MIVAKISTIYYSESDDHTIGYSNSCKRVCPESDSYRLFHFKCKESDFKMFVADTEEIVRNLIREYLYNYLSKAIRNFDSNDFRFQYSHTVVENNQFWIPCNIGRKYNLKTLEIM